MLETEWHSDAASIHEKLPQTMPEVLVDEINVTALGQLGCTLIERENSIFIVAEDYRDELEFLMPQHKNESPGMLDTAGMSSEWKAFFTQFHNRFSLDALAALAKGRETFGTYAKERGKMPELLLDEINEIASDTIGDLIVSESGICEDYLPEIQKYLAKE